MGWRAMTVLEWSDKTRIYRSVRRRIYPTLMALNSRRFIFPYSKVGY